MNADLAFDRLDGSASERSIIFLHGILGRGNNLRTIAKRFVEARPQWSALMVDLRGHGDSPKGTPSPSLEAAARDVIALASRTPQQPVGAIVGHSFGGKVALEVARLGEIGTLEHVFVIDSVPGAREPFRGPDSALHVVDVIEGLSQQSFASRSDFVDALMGAGLSRTLAMWLGSSVEEDGDRVRFALDLAEIRALMADYFACDLWPVVENPPGRTRVHLIIGERSGSYSSEDRERARRLASVSGDRPTVDVLPAGHWVHVDDPDGLIACMLRET